jgi:hypothetical protein
MSFGMAPGERIQAALVELHIAYGHNTPSGRALEHWNRIQQLIGHSSFPERAETMNASQREDFATGTRPRHFRRLLGSRVRALKASLKLPTMVPVSVQNYG